MFQPSNAGILPSTGRKWGFLPRNHGSMKQSVYPSKYLPFGNPIYGSYAESNAGKLAWQCLRIESNMAIGNWQCFIGHGYEGVPSNRRHDHEHCIGSTQMDEFNSWDIWGNQHVTYPFRQDHWLFIYSNEVLVESPDGRWPSRLYCWHACPVWREMSRPRTIQEMIIVNGETNDLQWLEVHVNKSPMFPVLFIHVGQPWGFAIL